MICVLFIKINFCARYNILALYPNNTSNDSKNMRRYLIEFRFSGYSKNIIKDLVVAISRNFRIHKLAKKKTVPHITLVGPLQTDDEKRLIREVENVAKKFDCVEFKINGFDRFDERAIFVNIKPLRNLDKLRNELVNKLARFCKLKSHDYGKYKPHATLVLDTNIAEKSSKSVSQKFREIMKFLKSWSVPDLTMHVLRVTILNDRSRIICEYDLMHKKMLSRHEALNRNVYRTTIEEYKKKQFDSKLARKVFKPLQHSDDSKIFVISDMHFDHKNIIRYCNRPFRSTREMNTILVKNWNRTVRKTDIVYFLGDMAFGNGRRSIDYWLSRLNGDIYFIRGNHDTDAITYAKVITDKFPIKYKDYTFLLMHDPYRPSSWDDWIIHGDKHNNSMEKFPHIHDKNKTVNVCAELTGYTPLSLDSIIIKTSM